MLEAEAIHGAFLAATGEVQALMNHLGLASRSAPMARLVYESDINSSLRRALQFGRTELVSVDSALGKAGLLAEPSDVVVAARTKVPQLAVEVAFHPRGEDHAGFANAIVVDVVKMALARSRDAVEQATVLIVAPGRFWRWLPGYAEERAGYALLNPQHETPSTVKSDFVSGPAWDAVFEAAGERQIPERLWTSLLATAEARSPWAELELRLIEVKGLGGLGDLRSAG